VDALAHSLAAQGRGARWPAYGLLAALLLGNLLLYLPQTAREFRQYNFVSGRPRAEVEKAITGEALVFIANHEPDWWTYGQFFSGNTPWLDGRIIYARDLGGENKFLLALFPGRPAYRWQDRRLIRIN
jgi:hypothetical protein